MWRGGRRRIGMNVDKLALLALLLGGCDSYLVSPSVTSLRIAGTLRYLQADADNEVNVVAAVIDQAASDFRCPPEQVHVAPGPKDLAHGVEACGHHGAYARVAAGGYVTDVPGHGQDRLFV